MLLSISICCFNEGLMGGSLLSCVQFICVKVNDDFDDEIIILSIDIVAVCVSRLCNSY